MRHTVVIVLGLLVLLIASTGASGGGMTYERFDNVDNAIYGANPLVGVPEYFWWHGCSPTAGGMLLGYWDEHPTGEWRNLETKGDISTYNATARNMIASPEHIADYWGWPDPNPGGHADNCVADFMGTSRGNLGNGGTWGYMMPQGLVAFSNWDDPSTALREGYEATSRLENPTNPWNPGTFSYDKFVAEIDAGRPMLINLQAYIENPNPDAPPENEYIWIGHSTVGYGYGMGPDPDPNGSGLYGFNVEVVVGPSNPADPAEWVDIWVPGFAILDTWGAGTAQSSWLAPGTYDPAFPDDYPATSTYVRSWQDGDGREWWPFLTFGDTGWYGYGFPEMFAWHVSGGVYYEPGVRIPEPGTLLLFGAGLGLLGLRLRRRP